MELSFASTLLMTHSRFADVYSLFEETVEVLPDDLVKDFMKDVDGIKQKLDKWKTLFAYEKEKKTFLEQKCHAGSLPSSLRDSKDATSQSGSCSNESVSTVATPYSERSSHLNNNEETLPLVLENDSDETWLLRAPTPVAPAPRKREECSKLDNSLKQKTPFPSKLPPKTKIPKPPLSPGSRGTLSKLQFDGNQTNAST